MMYFDSAATSLLKPVQVEEAVKNSFHIIGNAGRGAHAPTLNASRLLYDTREKLAQFFHAADSSEIAFAVNATEALNIAISGLIGKKDHVITTVCEHNSVLRPLYRKEEEGTELSFIEVDEKGRIRYEQLEEKRKENTKAVVITHASNLSGNVTDLKMVSEFTRKYNILLIVDASQTAGALPIDVQEYAIDVLCFTGHKSLWGPQGTGGLYVRGGLPIPSFKVGGSGIHSFDRHHPFELPEALEAGTLNGHGLAGLNAAIDVLNDITIKEIHERETKLAKLFAKKVAEIPEVILYGDMDAEVRAPIVSLNIGSMDSATVSDILWEDYEICVRAGAHCAPLMHMAFGTVEQGAVRFSFSYYNTEEEVLLAAKAIQEIAEDERE